MDKRFNSVIAHLEAYYNTLSRGAMAINQIRSSMSKIRNRFVYNLLCNWQSMLALFLNVFRFSPVSMMAALVLMLFRSITSGVGLLLIIPLLQVTGLSVGFAHGMGCPMP